MSVNDYFTRDIRLKHLRMLVAIEEAGRLTRAAQLLHVTQPALSKALTEIERSLGLPLFERTPHGLVPTAQGATLVRAARSALAEIERAGAELRRPAAKGAMRVLNVGVMPAVGWTLAATAIARLRVAQPDVTVRLVDGPTGTLLPQLVAGRLDLILGARIRATLPDGVEGIWLYDDPMRLVVEPQHPLEPVSAPPDHGPSRRTAREEGTSRRRSRSADCAYNRPVGQAALRQAERETGQSSVTWGRGTAPAGEPASGGRSQAARRCNRPPPGG